MLTLYMLATAKRPIPLPIIWIGVVTAIIELGIEAMAVAVVFGYQI